MSFRIVMLTPTRIMLDPNTDSHTMIGKWGQYLHFTRHFLPKIYDWAEANGGQVDAKQRCIDFKREEDATLFILRWNAATRL